MLKLKNTSHKSKQHQLKSTTISTSKIIHKQPISKLTKRTMSSTPSMNDLGAKIAQKRLEAKTKRPYNVESLLKFAGNPTCINDVTKPFHYKATAMEYTIIPSTTQINNDDIHSYVLSNLPKQQQDKSDGKSDSDVDDVSSPTIATIAFMTQNQFKKENLSTFFPSMDLSTQLPYLKTTKFQAKDEQMSIIMNPKTQQPLILMGLGDVIDGHSNTAEDYLTLPTFASTVHTATKYIKEKLQISNIHIMLPNNIYLTRTIKGGYGSGNGIPKTDPFYIEYEESLPDTKEKKKNKPPTPNVIPTIDNVSIEDIITTTLRYVTTANHTIDTHKDCTDIEDYIHLQSLFISPPTSSTTTTPSTLEPTTTLYKNFYDAINLAESEILSRELGNEPSSHATNQYMEDCCQLLAKTHENNGLKLKMYHEDELKKLGHNLIVAVGSASQENNRPRIAVFEYNNNNNQQSSSTTTNNNKAIGVIGKTLTFDTGALELKTPVEYMSDMFFDKLGGVTTLSIFRTIALNQPKLNRTAVGALAIAENAIGSKAIHPSSIFTEPNGKTVSITSPDAEGRLALASAISLVQGQHNVGEIYTMATLTGSVMVALGTYAAGIFTNNNIKANELLTQGLKHNEYYWQQPVFPVHHKNVKGQFSDLQNCMLHSRLSDASNAYAFMESFINRGTSFTHLDIAGVASLEEEDGIRPAGATGFGVHSVYDHIVTTSKL